MESETHGVVGLVEQLCQQLSKEQAPRKQMSLQQMRSKAFGALLHKNKSSCLRDTADDSNNMNVDVTSALDEFIFVNQMELNERGVKRNLYKEYEEQLSYLEQEEQYFSQGAGQRVLQFLLALKQDIQFDNAGVSQQRAKKRIFAPGPFTLHDNCNKTNPYMSKFQDLLAPKPKYFQSVQDMRVVKPCYTPRLLFDAGEPNVLAQIEKRHTGTPQNTASSRFTCGTDGGISFTGITQELWSDKMRIGAGTTHNLFNRPALPDIESRSARNFSDDDLLEELEDVELDQEERKFSWSWSQLGEYGVTCGKPYASESGLILELQGCVSESFGEVFEAKIVKHEQFLRDLKSLIVGIQSDIFTHNQAACFRMMQNITVDGLLPQTIKNLMPTFLECGTCYKRLQILATKDDYKPMVEGFVFRALTSALNEYLHAFRQIVFANVDDSLLSFYARMRMLMKQIVNLSVTLKIHPEVHSKLLPDMGCMFLGFLYREIINITDREYVKLLIFLLKRCCHVFFKHLQKWIFYGLLDDPWQELFIGFRDHYGKETKHFYDKAYYIRADMVPGFLQHYEELILQCGKYTLLLQACKPCHALFTLQYPSINVCLSFNQIKQLENECSAYFQKARRICGEPISIRQLYDSQKQKKLKFRQQVAERSRQVMQKWLQEQQALNALLNAKKRRRNAELVEQIAAAEQQKINRKREDIALEMQVLKSARQLEDKRLLEEREVRRKRVAYYEELNATVQQKQQAHKKSTPNLYVSNLLQTPATSIAEDFLSCSGGEEDVSSEYAECETDALAIINNNERPKAASLEEELHQAVELAAEPPIKRSVSDYLNSNVLTPPTPNSNNVSAAAPELRVISADDTLLPSEELTVAERNKRRVMAHEHIFSTPEILTRSMPDINSNTQLESTTTTNATTITTELQRNRQRMMHNENPFVEFNKPALSERKLLQLDLDTECGRNRRRVLESEYHILTGELSRSTTRLQPAQQLETPMSTSSDTALDKLPEQATAQSISQSDAMNGNAVSDRNLEKLKIVSSASADANTPHTPDAGTPVETLNTAAVISMHGFDFSREKMTCQLLSPPQHLAYVEDELDGFKPMDYSKPYTRCKQLLESNFNNTGRKSCFSLPKPETQMQEHTAHKQEDVRGLTVISLTDFLQKSVLIPLSAHFEIVNNEVMRMFLIDLHLLDHFKTLRNYFLLMDGEFSSIICDRLIGGLEEHGTPERLMNFPMLASILDKALGSRIMAYDSNADNLSFNFSDPPTTFDLHSPAVFGNLSLCYRVDWPLNLILNPETLEQYANIFRYLLKVRRISWVLERSYQLLKEAVKRLGPELLKSPQYRHVQLIRHKFYHFVHALQDHITANALQASWKTFKDELLCAKSIEDIYRKHTHYIKRILFLCMLNRRSVEFYNAIDNVFKVSLKFYHNLKSRDFILRSPVNYYVHPRYAKLVADEAELNKFVKYTIYLGKKIVRRGYQVEIEHFINLIDFNGYYTQELMIS